MVASLDWRFRTTRSTTTATAATTASTIPAVAPDERPLESPDDAPDGFGDWDELGEADGVDVVGAKVVGAEVGLNVWPTWVGPLVVGLPVGSKVVDWVVAPAKATRRKYTR